MILGDNELIFAKVRSDAIIPSKKEENAAYDIYANFSEDFLAIYPHTTKLVPTGIASAMNKSKYIQLEERGSTGGKGIKKSAGVIDSGFRGEWFVALTNTNKYPIVISKLSREQLLEKYYMKNDYIIDLCKYTTTIFYPYDKAIAQAVVHEVPKMNIYELTYQKLLMIESERGTGQLGSSNK